MISETRLLCAAALLMIAAFVTGCGEKTVEAPNVSKLEASQNCIDCHQGKISPVTGRAITEEWRLSAHNTRNKAGCADCHEPASGHPDNCNRCHGLYVPKTKGYEIGVSRNPDKDGKCSKCHTRYGGFGMSEFDGITSNTQIEHFNNITSPANASGSLSGYPASFVSSQNVNSCRNCHNPHDTSSQMRQLREWARSGKGNIYAKPWTQYDFKTRGTPTPGASPANSYGDDCVRCHTTTGFVNFVTSGFKSIAPSDSYGTVYPKISPDKTKETLGCRACHDDGAGNAYSYKVRRVPQVTAYYNYSINSRLGATNNKIRQIVPKTYPDVSSSNVCVACHVGREVGELIRITSPFTNFSSIGFINSHYLTAGATIFRAGGFHFYTSQAKYANKPFYLHDQIGIADKNKTGNDGPCITCHIGQDGEYKRHTFLPTDRTGSLVAKACVKCHDPATSPSSSAMNGTVIEEERAGFNAALAVLAKSLKDKGIVFTDGYPYFGTSASPLKNWRKFTGGYGSGLVPAAGNIQAGALTMGAAFNLNMLVHDYGAFAHNRFYVKRLIYDAIDWIQDGVMGNGIEAGVASLKDDPSLFVLSKDGTVFKIDSATKSLAISYLQGTSANPSGTGGIRP
ncbi:MAG: hypothetical protein WCP10_08835 [Desulfuromonadales bacterium]